MWFEIFLGRGFCRCLFIYFVRWAFCSWLTLAQLSLAVSEFRSPSHLSGLNRSASLSCTERVDALSTSGSNSQLNSTSTPQYVPDFNVRALSDLQLVKVGFTVYSKKWQSGSFGLKDWSLYVNEFQMWSSFFLFLFFCAVIIFEYEFLAFM